MEAPAFYGSSPVRPRLTVVKDDGVGYSALPHDIMRDTRLSRDARLLYAILQGHWWQGGECWASHATLAAEMGCKERMLRYYLTELLEAGVITERRRGHGQAKAYAPAKAARDCQLNGQGDAALGANRQEIAGQAATDCQYKRQPVADRRRSTEEDSLKEEHSGGSVAADAAPAPTETAPPTDSKPKRQPRRARRDVASESPAPPTIDLTDQSYETAAKWGFDRAAVDFQLERFLSKARAKGWTYADWKAAFRTWLLNEVQYAKRDGRSVALPSRSATPTPRPAQTKPANVRTY